MQIINYNDYSRVKLKLLDSLSSSNLVIFPTDTAYALLADATSDKALEKLLRYKGDGGDKPISIAVDSIEMAKDYVIINDCALSLYDKYLPGALTIISEKKLSNLSRLISTKNTVGIRIPNDLNLLDLIHSLGKPVTITSCNISNNPTIYSLKDFIFTTPLIKQKEISYFVRENELQYGVSTIVDTTSGSIEIIRVGVLSINL